MNAIRNMSGRLGLGLAAAGFVAATAGAPGTARADRWGVSVSLGGQPTWVPPVYESQPRTVVVPAVYETRTARVWREPVYEDRRVLIEIPARTVVREVPRYGPCGRVIGYDRIVAVIEPARREWRIERVLVQPGRWETVTEQVCVRPERTEVVHDNVVAAPGYWAPSGGIAFGYQHGHGSAAGMRIVGAPTPYGPARAAVSYRR